MVASTHESQKVKVLYIGGYGRSGSTLLVRLLGQLPTFHAVGELWNVWQKCFIDNQLCGCGKPFKECEFWSAVVEEAFGGFDQVEIEQIMGVRRALQSHTYLPLLAYPQLRSSEQQRTIDTYLATLSKFYRAIQDVSGCKVIIDSSKGPRYAMLLREIDEIDLRVVHLTRDSRAVVYSWQKKMVKPEVYWKTDYMERPNPVGAALNWNITNMLTQGLGKGSTGYKFLRYEDLIDSAATQLSAIARFAGEEVDVTAALAGDGAANLAADHTAVGNPNRFRQGPVELRRDDEWRARMPARQKTLVTSLTLPLLQKYGYLGTTSASA